MNLKKSGFPSFFLLGLSGLMLCIYACSSSPRFWERSLPESDWRVKRLSSDYKPPDGNAEKGFRYLVEGDYIGSGIPFDFYQRYLLEEPDTVLRRAGDNERLPYAFNAFTAPNGVKVVNGNCFTCHAGKLNGEIVFGLGNYASDFQKSLNLPSRFLQAKIRSKYGKKSDEYKAFEDFGHFFRAIAPRIKTSNPGVNPAFRLEEACTVYRNPASLSHEKDKNFKIHQLNIASDVPPLWNVKKKNSLYYNGMGRGDLSKLLIQASVLGTPDSFAARQSAQNFQDVVSWLYSLQAPEYPGEIDKEGAILGEKVFSLNCQKCHGTYGDNVDYPNKLVSLDLIKTDPVYARYFLDASHLAGWYNQSWFALSPPYSRLDPEPGYVAPPLDGIWATAPYLHNGSVPTLQELLNSTERPTFWEKQMDEKGFVYDHEKLGITYLAHEKAKGKQVYNTNLLGYSNRGHYFGDKLTKQERAHLLEYLKTL